MSDSQTKAPTSVEPTTITINLKPVSHSSRLKVCVYTFTVFYAVTSLLTYLLTYLTRSSTALLPVKYFPLSDFAKNQSFSKRKIITHLFRGGGMTASPNPHWCGWGHSPHVSPPRCLDLGAWTLNPLHRERKCADTIGTVPVPMAGHFRC